MNHSRRNHILIFFLFAVLTLIMTWPVAARLGTHLAGGRDDLWVHQWTFWWIREALRQGVSPFFTPYLYAPAGASLTSHNIAWFNIALWLPLQAIAGRIAAYNLVFLAVITLNGFCMYLFAWAQLRSYAAALVSGIVFGFWPYTLSHYDHANMMVLFWVPLALLLIHKLIGHHVGGGKDERGREQWLLVLGTALALAMIGITRWQLLIMSGPILLAYTLYLLWRTPPARSRATISELLAAGMLALLLMAPLAAPLVIDQFTREFPQDLLLDEAIWGRTDLLAYFVPSIHNGIWRARVAVLYESFVVNQLYTPFLGFLTLFLAFIGLIRRWKESWIWLLLALFYLLLALGPELAVNGRSYPAIPMPYRLIEDLFLMQLIRRPDRLNIFLSLPLAMLAGWGMQAVLAGIPGLTARRAVSATVLLLILVAYSPIPFATTLPETPTWLTEAAARDGEFTILDIPVNDRSYDKWYMQYQTDHGLQMATGHVSRLPRESKEFLNSVPFIADLPERDQRPDPAVKDIGRQLDLLAGAGIRYIVIHKQFANEGLQQIWRDWLAIDPYHEDEELLVYKTDPQLGADIDLAHQLGSGVGIVAVAAAPKESVQGGAVRVDTVLATEATLPENLAFCLVLVDADERRAASTCEQLGNGRENDLWRTDSVLPITKDVSPGRYSLAADLLDIAVDARLQTAVLDEIIIHPFAPEYPATAVWQGGINLLGSDVHANEEDLIVTLYWRAGSALVDSYKVFVHLIDARSGEIVAQRDTVPVNWTYPTNAWLPGEIVRDEITLPIDDLAEGAYTIRVGLYDELSGERLAVEAANEMAAEESFLITEWRP